MRLRLWPKNGSIALFRLAGVPVTALQQHLISMYRAASLQCVTGNAGKAKGGSRSCHL
jgi:hypothetical protein